MKIVHYSKVLTLVLIFGILGVSCGGSGENNNNETTNGPQTQQQQQQQTQKTPQQLQRQRPQPAKNVSDKELKKFAEVFQKLQEIRQGARGKMKDAITDEGMEMKRYRQLRMQQQNPKMAKGDTSMTAEEQKQMQNIQKKMRKIQSSTQPKMQKTLKESEFSLKRYKRIYMGIQQDTSLYNRFAKHLDNPPQKPGARQRQPAQ